MFPYLPFSFLISLNQLIVVDANTFSYQTDILVLDVEYLDFSKAFDKVITPLLANANQPSLS